MGYKNYEAQGEGAPFNMSLATLERINNILILTQKYRLIGHAPITIRCLNSLLKEVYPFLKPEEKTEGIETYRKLNSDLNNGLLGNGQSYNFVEIDTFELWLRDQLKAKKLLMTAGESAGTALR